MFCSADRSGSSREFTVPAVSVNDGLEQVSSGPHSTLARQVLPSSGGAPSPTGAEPGTRAGLRAVGPLSLPPAPTCARSASRPGPGPDFCLPLPRRLPQPLPFSFFHVSEEYMTIKPSDSALVNFRPLTSGHDLLGSVLETRN